MSTLDDVISTVLRAREDGPDALAAVALSFGSAMELGTLGNTALKSRLAEARDAMTAADEDIATLRHERDAALAELKAALESTGDTRAEVWRLREAVEAIRDERDRAVQEREAFSLRLSAAEHARDENRNAWAEACRERDALRARPTYEARATAPTRQELRLHREQHGGWWIVTRAGDRPTVLRLGADDADDAGASPATPRTWVPLGADGLPCAWPVVP